MRYASLLFVSFIDNHSKISFPYGNMLKKKKKNSINETRSHTFVYFFLMRITFTIFSFFLFLDENRFNTHGPNYESTFSRINCSWKTATSTVMC